MPRFLAAHATHPDAGMALALAAAQLDARIAALAAGFRPTLGLVYLTDAYAPRAELLLAELQQRWPGVHWAGTSAVGIAASGVEYFDEPALALLLSDLPAAQFSLFSGRQPLQPERAHSALVHADPGTPDLAELIAELADRTPSGYLFGGLSSAPTRRLHIADGVFEGGLSGVGFAAGVTMVSRVTQGCQPVGPTRRITRCQRNLVLTLDDQPALPRLLADLGLPADALQSRPEAALGALRRTLAGITDAEDTVLNRGGQFDVDTRVRHLIGIDPPHDGVALADLVETGQRLTFCRRDTAAARRDLVRICAEIREAVEPEEATLLPAGAPGAEAGGEPASRIAGAVYVSCSGRGGPHFGAPSAELQIVQHALGDVPLVGFFAAGEVAHHHLYGYTGVLTVFVAD